MRSGCHVAGLACLALTSCNAILGIEDRPARPDAAATTDAGDADTGVGGDSSPDAPGTSAYAAEVLSDAPLLYLRLGERGGTVAHDEVRRFDGTFPSLGVTFAVRGAIPGDADGAVLFDGSSRLTMPPSADFTGLAAFSVEVWIQRDASAGAIAFVVDHESWSGARFGWDLIGGSDGLAFERYAANGDHVSLTANTLPAGEWHHVVATWDGSLQTILVDGALARQSGPSDVALAALPGAWAIAGQNCSCSGNSFVGALDEFAVYDKVLTQDRIKAHLRAAGR